MWVCLSGVKLQLFNTHTNTSKDLCFNRFKKIQVTENILKMSASNRLSTLDSLECHFTWDLNSSTSKLLRLRDAVVDIGTEDGNPWLGHIYNLLGFLNYKLGQPEEARDFFNKATETFLQLGEVEEGAWLVVNYGNLAWMHNHLKEDDESQRYLTMLNTLTETYPAPNKDKLHPEVYAEKAWTLMKFDIKKKLQAVEYFQEAIRMKPGIAAWQTSRALAVWGASKHDDIRHHAEVIEEIKMARQEDPENLFLAAIDLMQAAERKEDVSDETEELKEKILQNPVSSYSGIKMLIRIYKELHRYQEAIDVTEEALQKHPDARFLKRCCALSYKWKIIHCSNSQLPRMISRALSLHEELVSLYPDSSLVKKMDLAIIHTKSFDGVMRAEQIYKEVMERDLEPAEKQMVYFNYAKFLHYDLKERQKSVRFHMKAVNIPCQSFFRNSSISALRKIADRQKNSMSKEIMEFLKTLPDLDSL